MCVHTQMQWIHIRDFIIIIFFGREKHACKFGDQLIIVSSDSQPPRQEGVETAVNKNPGLIFFGQYHRCSCPPTWRVATLFFILFNLSRLNVIRVAIQNES